MAETWPTPTPRHELLARVATTGRRRILVRRIAAAVAAASVATSAAVGLGVGRSGGIDLVAESISLEGAADAVAPFSACSGGAPIGELHRDDRVFLTGRDEGAAWLELRSPSDASDRVWVPAAVVGADGDVEDLPVHGCTTEGDQLALPGQTTTTLPPTTIPGETTTTSTTAPGETTTTAAPGTTTSTTPPSTQAPDVAGPAITKLSNGGVDVILGEIEGVCSGTTAPVSATVSDASGVAWVQLLWSYTPQNGTTITGQKSMNLSAGRYRANLGVFDSVSGPDPEISWWVRARDVHGDETTVGAPVVERAVLGECLG